MSSEGLNDPDAPTIGDGLKILRILKGFADARFDSGIGVSAIAEHSSDILCVVPGQVHP